MLQKVITFFLDNLPTLFSLFGALASAYFFLATRAERKQVARVQYQGILQGFYRFSTQLSCTEDLLAFIFQGVENPASKNSSEFRVGLIYFLECVQNISIADENDIFSDETHAENYIATIRNRLNKDALVREIIENEGFVPSFQMSFLNKK